MANAAEKILVRMKELVRDPASGWNPVPNNYAPTVRFTATEQTPDYQRGTGFGRWDQDTYDTHVFVTLVAGKVLLGTSAAPWMPRYDRDITFWLAEAILEDPALAHDGPRQLELRQARRAGRPDGRSERAGIRGPS